MVHARRFGGTHRLDRRIHFSARLPSLFQQLLGRVRITWRSRHTALMVLPDRRNDITRWGSEF